MKSRQPRLDEQRGRVVQFRPQFPRSRNDNFRPGHQKCSPVKYVGKYARGEDDGYHHRMVNNLLACVVLCLIVYCGIWIADTMAQMRRDQDCVLTGHTNCAPIKVRATTQ